MPTPCNACPVGQNDRTGACPVGSGNPTGVESFLFLSRSMLSAPCAMLATPLGLYAPCSMRHACYSTRAVLFHWGLPRGMQFFL
jgi:hypothetical protein